MGKADVESGPDAGASPVWRHVRAERAHVVIDAAAYFDLLQQAMLAARQRIMLLGWDFDTRIRFGEGRRWWHRRSPSRYPARLGGFVVWLVHRRPGLRVLALRWRFGATKLLLRGVMLLDLLRWAMRRRITFRLDGALPPGCSHHEKVVVIDDMLAACGGIDMTRERWDTSEHRDNDPHRRDRLGHRWRPWHDLAMLVEGEAAAALGDLARERWQRSGAPALPPCEARDSLWPPALSAEFQAVEIGIARTRAAWRGTPAVREVEALFLDHIARARRFIYAESQYFASRRIAEAIAARLAEPEPPEIVLVTSAASTSWFQRLAMDTPRQRLLSALARVDHAGRFHAFVPMTAGGTPIYVHSKLMIVDDVVLQLGSANLNNRSLGLDSECDLVIDARRPGNAHAAPPIAALRCRLLAEHCGLAEEAVRAALAADGSMAALVASLPRSGRRLAPLSLHPVSEARKALADTELLDPEFPGEIFSLFGRHHRLFSPGGVLSAPDQGETTR